MQYPAGLAATSAMVAEMREFLQRFDVTDEANFADGNDASAAVLNGIQMINKSSLTVILQSAGSARCIEEWCKTTLLPGEWLDQLKGVDPETVAKYRETLANVVRRMAQVKRAARNAFTRYVDSNIIDLNV